MNAVIRGTGRIGEWIGERANPLLVKEIRQSLKSRQFVFGFGLVLLACWLISVAGMLLSGGQTTMLMTASGREFFCFYYGVLSFAIFVIVPFQSFRSLIGERDQYTFELLSITTMSPGQIVRGKLSSAIAQMCLFYGAIAPFIAMTILLKGVSIPVILFLLIVSAFVSTGLSALALMIGASCKNRIYQTGLTLVVVLMLLPFWGMSLQLFLELLDESRVPFDDYRFWVSMTIFLSFYIFYFLLALQLSVSFLTFEADNRSTKVRLCVMAVFCLTYGWSIAGLLFDTARTSYLWHDFDSFLASFLVIHALIASIIICFEPDQLSRRVSRQVCGRRFRLFMVPLLPGGTRGLIFCYLQLGLSLLVTSIFVTTHDYFVFGIFLYATIYVSVAALINRICQKWVPQYRPLLGRVITLLACTIGAISPYIAYAFEQRDPPPIFSVSHPFVTLDYLYENHVDSSSLILILGVTAFVTVALNVRAMCRAIVETALVNDGTADH